MSSRDVLRSGCVQSFFRTSLEKHRIKNKKTTSKNPTTIPLKALLDTNSIMIFTCMTQKQFRDSRTQFSEHCMYMKLIYSQVRKSMCDTENIKKNILIISLLFIFIVDLISHFQLEYKSFIPVCYVILASSGKSLSFSVFLSQTCVQNMNTD